MKWYLSGVALLAIAGCQSPPTTVAENSTSTSEPAATDSQPAASNSGSESSPSTSEPANPSPNTSKEPDPTVNSDIKPVPKPGHNGWSVSKLTLADVGKKIGTSLSTLSGTECRAVVSVLTPAGKGTIFLVNLIDNPNLYRVEHIEADSEPRRVVVLADGKMKRELTPAKLSLPISLAKPLSPIATLSDPNRFPREFSRSMISGVVDRTEAWGRLVSNLSKPNSGFTASVEERHPVLDGKTYTNYRIWAQRTPAAAKKLGPAEFEIVLDPKRWVPVTIRTQSTDLKGKKWSYDWTAGWKFNQKIDKKLFDFRTPPVPKAPQEQPML